MDVTYGVLNENLWSYGVLEMKREKGHPFPLKLRGTEPNFRWISVHGWQLAKCALLRCFYFSKFSLKLDNKIAENLPKIDIFKISQAQNIFQGFS